MANTPQPTDPALARARARMAKVQLQAAEDSRRRADEHAAKGEVEDAAIHYAAAAAYERMAKACEI